MNKYLQINKNGQLQIGGITADSIAKDFGTPLYVMDYNRIEDVCNSFVKAMGEYGDGAIAYASKAFSCREIYRIVSKLGLYADSVSIGEIYTAISAGFNPNNLIFHGNNKSFLDLEYAIKTGVGNIVVDSFTEVDDIDLIAQKSGVIQNVMVRINPGIEAHTHHYIQTAKIDSKFGFSISNNEAERIISYIKTKPNIKLIGLHCHIGSQIFEKKSFVLACQKMIEFYKYLFDKYSLSLDALNLGGGFGIYYSEGDKILSPENYYDYVKEVCTCLTGQIEKYKIKKPFLIFEPGRSIVGEAGVTLYTAGRIKNIPDVKDYVSVDGGMFENPRFALYQAKYTVLSANKMLDKCDKKYTISGKCCESGDVIAEDVMLPKTEEGDLLAVLSTGAYNYSMASNYNRNLIPPVVLVKDKTVKYIVKPQTLDDLIRNDV